jgi:Mce-associated membrane protein
MSGNDFVPDHTVVAEVDGAGQLIANQSADGVDDAEAVRGHGHRAHGHPHRTVVIAGSLIVIMIGSLAGWMGFRAHQAQQSAHERGQFLAGARQGALNLTTIDWQHVQEDVQRIVDSATGTFYGDFTQRSGPFVDVVEQAKSKSEGQVVEAGLESSSDNDAQALVAVTVKTSTANAPDSPPRAWRMRISLQKVGNDVKLSNVEFVP